MEKSEDVHSLAVKAEERRVGEVLGVIESPLSKRVHLGHSLGVARRAQHDDVVTVGALLALSGVVVGIGVGAGPSSK